MFVVIMTPVSAKLTWISNSSKTKSRKELLEWWLDTLDRAALAQLEFVGEPLEAQASHNSSNVNRLDSHEFDRQGSAHLLDQVLLLNSCRS